MRIDAGVGLTPLEENLRDTAFGDGAAFNFTTAPASDPAPSADTIPVTVAADACGLQFADSASTQHSRLDGDLRNLFICRKNKPVFITQSLTSPGVKQLP